MSRHPAVESLLNWLVPNPNLAPGLGEIAASCHGLAIEMVNHCPEDTPELTAGLRKLLEAKDCFVRAAMEANPAASSKMPATHPYADDPELREIYDKLTAGDCGHLERRLVEFDHGEYVIYHCRLADGHSGEHEPRIFAG